MSFLDNLENTLKNLEKGEELADNRERREAERAIAVAAGPWAEKLRTSDWTKMLLGQAAAASHGLRAKLYMAWIGNNLRLDVREHRLELRPAPEGIFAVLLENGIEQRSEAVDLNTDPAGLIRRWLPGSEH
jgi:hypothetical protein